MRASEIAVSGKREAGSGLPRRTAVKAFSYVNATNEKEAIQALSAEREKALPIGGGQDLLARLKDYVTQPDRIVNVKALDSAVTSTPDGGLKIGAAMKIVD